MSTDKTLADVQPGGRVRLGDGPLQKAYDDLRFYVDASQLELEERGISREDALDIARESEAALAAQPSPGGQGDAQVTDEMVSAASRAYHAASAAGSRTCMRSALEAALDTLAARQPVGEPVDDDAASEAFAEFADDYLTDGNGYAPASTYEACGKAFNAAWPDRVAATAAARAELKRLHGDDRTVGARRAEALNRAAARDDAEDDAAQPAQAGDLGQFRDLVTTLVDRCGDDLSADQFVLAGRLLNLIDSQAVGK